MSRKEVCEKKLQRVQEESDKLQKSFQLTMNSLKHRFNRYSNDYNAVLLNSTTTYYQDIEVLEGELDNELKEKLKAYNFNDQYALTPLK